MALTLHVENFQSLESVDVQFEGFTAITGPSNVGKSALIRALQAIMTNDLHKTWIRHGTKRATVRLNPDLPGLRSMEFVKGGTINSYSLVTDESPEPVKLPKVGKVAPDQVRDAGFSLLETDRETEHSLHVARQLEPLFLVADSEPEITSIINSIFGTAPFEAAQRSVADASRKTGQKYKDVSIRVQEDQRDLKDWTEYSEKVEALATQYAEEIERLQSLERKLQTLREVSGEHAVAARSVVVTKEALVRVQEQKAHTQTHTDAIKRYGRLAIRMQQIAAANEAREASAVRFSDLKMRRELMVTVAMDLRNWARMTLLRQDREAVAMRMVETGSAVDQFRHWVAGIVEHIVWLRKFQDFIETRVGFDSENETRIHANRRIGWLVSKINLIRAYRESVEKFRMFDVEWFQFDQARSIRDAQDGQVAQLRKTREAGIAHRKEVLAAMNVCDHCPLQRAA